MIDVSKMMEGSRDGRKTSGKSERSRQQRLREIVPILLERVVAHRERHREEEVPADVVAARYLGSSVRLLSNEGPF